MILHTQHSIISAFCMYGSELLGGLQPPEPPPPPRSATATDCTFSADRGCTRAVKRVEQPLPWFQHDQKTGAGLFDNLQAVQIQR